MKSLAFLCAVTVAGAPLLGGCAPSRSPEAFCATYWEQKEEYISKYDAAATELENTGDPLVGLLGGTAMLAQSLGDTVVIFEKLERVAPDDIQPDVAIIRDSLQAQIDSASDMATNPLGALVGGLFQSLTTGGSWQRVGDYVVTYCGEKGAPS